jgi:hypothetical protein
MWSKKDGFPRQGFSQTFNTSPFGRPRTKIISGQYKTRLYFDQVSSVRFDGSKPILVVSWNMLYFPDLLLKWSTKNGF